MLAVESLESRDLLSADSLASQAATFDPSPFEQEMLEHLNRMRMAPQAELEILFTDVGSATARDSDARLAMTVYQDPSAEEITTEWANLSPVEPLGWNVSLYEAASDHNTLMAQYDDQSHLLPGELSLVQRLAASGYQGSAVGENVFAYMNNVFHGHSAFSIDWGVPDRSHRDNMMASTFREVGISILGEDDAATQVGPLLVTQDFGDGSDWLESYLLGVVWDDTNENGWYDAGEGFSDVEIVIEGTGGTFTTITMTAGGYQSFIPDGLYTVTASGGGLPSPMIVHDVLIGNQNVKVDFEYDPSQSLAPLVDLNGPAEAGVAYQTTFYEDSAPIPITSIDGFLSDDDSDQLVSLTATITNLRDGSEYLVADTTGTSIAAVYDAPGGTLTLSGAASLSDYQQVLATLGYGNVSATLDETPRVIEVVVSDGTNFGTAEVTVFVVRTTLPELAIDDLRVEENAEGSTTYKFTVQMSETTDRTVTVDFATEGNSAVAGADYNEVQQTITFAPGETVKKISFTLINDDVPEGVEAFFAKLTNSSGATVARGEATVTIVDDDVAVKLGAIDFLGIQGIDLTNESALYRFAATRDGLLSIEVTGTADDELSLVLYDRYRTLETVLSRVSTGGVARIDLPGVSAGETYYLEVAGTAPEAELLLGNVIRQAGSEIAVLGTNGNDAFEFEAGESLRVSLNGLAYSYSWDEVDRVVFSGGGGTDQAALSGSDGDDTVKLTPGSGVLTSAGYTVSLDETETIQVVGGGGNDSAQLYDSVGDDSLVSEGKAGTLSGEGFANSVAEFNTILGYATAGGTDSAQIAGTEDYEEFIGKSSISKVAGNGFYLRTKYFDHVTVEGNGGDDFARIYGDAGAEHFTGGPNWGEMAGVGFHYRVEDYLSVHGYARGKTGDTATLVDSSGDDTLIVTPIYVKIFGDGYLTRAKFFPNVEVIGTGEGADSARLYDSEGDDTFLIGAETRASGEGFAHEVSGFGTVAAYWREGGADVVSFYDTAGDDTFVTEVKAAYLTGGGFVGRAYGFHDVRAYATAGGDDTARFYADGAGSTFRGSVSASMMDGSGTHRRAEAFEAVYAEAGDGVDTAVFEASGSQSDLYESGDDWQRLSNEALGVLIETQRFERVTGPFDEDGSE